MSPSKPANRVQTAYLGLGGNLGDRRALLADAICRLARLPGVRVTGISPVHETKAVGLVDQPDFLNLVVSVETALPAHALLDACLEVERQLGRIRLQRWGPRTVDIDLLLHGDTFVADEKLVLPHPRMHERAFVLAPLAALAPDLVVHGRSVAALLACADRSGVTVRADLAIGHPLLLEEVALSCPPHELFARLAAREHAFLLDSARDTDGLGGYSFFGCEPFRVFRAKDGTDTLGELRRLLRTHRTPGVHPHLPGGAPAPRLPFAGGAVGFFSYELCAQLERLPTPQPDDRPEIPDCELAFYDAFFAHEHATGRTWLVANPVAASTADTLFTRLRALLSEAAPPICRPPGEHQISVTRPVANFDAVSYAAAIGRIKDYIASGDVYQVNLSQRFSVPLASRPYELYLRLREKSPAPFAAYLAFGPVQVISSSPERFLSLRGRVVETRPIKGTRPRSADTERDARLAAELQASEKDRAELLMIVDLERNDLGRVCDYGSVRVDRLWRLESHPTVHHLVTTVTGELRAGLDALDCLRAAFPGGSITGAPKIRAMEIIRELEPHRRHVYTGAIGYIGFDGDADLNIAIRTITCSGGLACYHAGGGVVWDSDPAAEYQETLDKGRAMRDALAGSD